MPTALSPTELKAIVSRHFEDFVDRQRPEVILQNMISDFLDHDGPGGKPTGVDGDEGMMRNTYKLFPDLHIEIEDMFAEDDKVVCRNRWRGTNASAGHVMEFHGFVQWRFEGDRVAECRATVTPPAEVPP